MFFKNVASQTITVYAWDTSNNAWKTGDAANITAYISKDGGAPAATNDTNPTEIDATNMPGAYRFTMQQAETNCDNLELVPKSATSNISLIPVSLYPTALTNAAIAYLDAAISSRVSGAAMTELTGDAGATPTPVQAIMRLYMEQRNETTTTNTLKTIKNDADAAIITQTISDDDTTATKGKDT